MIKKEMLSQWDFILIPALTGGIIPPIEKPASITWWACSSNRVIHLQKSIVKIE